jgi:hypothetical protein
MIRFWLASVCASALLLGCVADDDPVEATAMTREQLLNPETCKDCHPNHYREWSASMHAYASEDPVFRAMNARGQREAQFGNFCVKCHAPMAVSENLTQDGLNLDQLPSHLKGVTCYFCHNAVGVGEPHNNSLFLADDTIMRGGIKDPVKTSAHGAKYSEFHDSTRIESSAMCGSCHDIMTPKRVHLERTFEEYKGSITSKQDAPGTFQTCQNCHMDAYSGVAAQTVDGVKNRTVHEHLWPAVDVALTDFPDQQVMRLAVEQCQLGNGVRPLFIEATGDVGGFEFFLETIAGHNMPSGSSHDRRMWLEVVAKDAQGRIWHESGTFADDAPENFKTPSPAWTFHDHIFNERGEEVHMFWDAAPSAAYPLGFDGSASLPAAKSTVAFGHTQRRIYNLGIAPAHADIRLRMRPIAREVLDDLVRSGDLDPSIPPRMPTFTVRKFTVDWPNPGSNPEDFVLVDTTDKDCQRYKCLLSPGATAESCGLTQAP